MKTLLVALMILAILPLISQTGNVSAQVPSPWCGYGNLPYNGWYGGYVGWYDYYYNYYDCYPYGYSYPGYYGYYGYCGYYGYSCYNYPASYNLKVSTDPAGIASTSGNGAYTQGSTATFSLSTTTVQTATDTRYVFSGWRGDYSGIGTSGSITMDRDKNIVAVYQPQYLLTASAYPSNAPIPANSGWYNSGETVTLTAQNVENGSTQAVRLAFENWVIDGQDSSNSVTASIVMDLPHTVTAKYKTQYYLSVLTDHGVASGSGWYDAGTTATVFVTTPASPTFGVTTVFAGWTGDVTSSSQSASLLMDGPKTAIATWRTDSTLLTIVVLLGLAALLASCAGTLVYVIPRRRPQQLKASAPS